MNFPPSQPKPLPLFVRASELLAREISAGHWQQGERIPTEAQLSDTLGMAVGTVRKALAELARRGLLERRHGSGTYVSSPKVVRGESGARQRRSVYEFFRLELAQGGGLPTATLLDLCSVPKPGGEAAFGASRSRTWYRVRRLRWLNETPAALEEIWFDARHRKNLKPADLSEALYLFYKESLGFWIARVDDQVTVGAVPGWCPPEFALQSGQACGTIRRKSWSGADQIEELSTTWFNPAVAHYAARWR
jgi:GntR family transcriptional regulator